MDRWVLTLLVASGLAVAPAAAGLFDKKPKVDPSKRVQELLQALGASQDTGHRARAAEELREFDAGIFPEIVPNLILSLEKDPSVNVRREAAQSLGKLRPASADALKALEVAADKDASLLVRMQAKSSKLGYRVPDAKPPEGGGQVIKVPPPGPDGKIKPVPVPDLVPQPAPMPLPKPKPIDGPGPKLVPPPPVPQPIDTPPVADVPPPPAPKVEQGPILLPPPPGR